MPWLAKYASRDTSLVPAIRYQPPALGRIYASRSLADLVRACRARSLNDPSAFSGSFGLFDLSGVSGFSGSPGGFSGSTNKTDQTDQINQLDQLVALYLGGADRDKLDPILDACVAVYKEQLNEDGQVDFKGKAKAFTRAYGFLSSILPYTNAEWEKLSIFLYFLVPKLPAPKEEDISKGILEAIDMDS